MILDEIVEDKKKRFPGTWHVFGNRNAAHGRGNKDEGGRLFL